LLIAKLLKSNSSDPFDRKPGTPTSLLVRLINREQSFHICFYANGSGKGTVGLKPGLAIKGRKTGRYTSKDGRLQQSFMAIKSQGKSGLLNSKRQTNDRVAQ